MYWIPGKLRTPLHRRSGREGSRASRGGPGRGTLRKSIGMAVHSGFLCFAPPWPSSRSWFCFEEPDPFPCPGKFVGSFSRQSRCSAPPFPSSRSVSLCRVRPFLNVGSHRILGITPVAVFLRRRTVVAVSRCHNASAQEVAVAGHSRLGVPHFWPVDHRRMGACSV